MMFVGFRLTLFSQLREDSKIAPIAFLLYQQDIFGKQPSNMHSVSLSFSFLIRWNRTIYIFFLFLMLFLLVFAVIIGHNKVNSDAILVDIWSKETILSGEGFFFPTITQGSRVAGDYYQKRACAEPAQSSQGTVDEFM